MTTLPEGWAVCDEHETAFPYGTECPDCEREAGYEFDPYEAIGESRFGLPGGGSVE